jgi:hypothetical protein
MLQTKCLNIYRVQHKHVDFKASVLSECDALKLFDEIFHVEVVWDEDCTALICLVVICNKSLNLESIW